MDVSLAHGPGGAGGKSEDEEKKKKKEIKRIHKDIYIFTLFLPLISNSPFAGVAVGSLFLLLFVCLLVLNRL